MHQELAFNNLQITACMFLYISLYNKSGNACLDELLKNSVFYIPFVLLFFLGFYYLCSYFSRLPYVICLSTCHFFFLCFILSVPSRSYMSMSSIHLQCKYCTWILLFVRWGDILTLLNVLIYLLQEFKPHKIWIMLLVR